MGKGVGWVPAKGCTDSTKLKSQVGVPSAGSRRTVPLCSYRGL